VYTLFYSIINYQVYTNPTAAAIDFFPLKITSQWRLIPAPTVLQAQLHVNTTFSMAPVQTAVLLSAANHGPHLFDPFFASLLSTSL